MNKADVDLALAELVHWHLTPGCSSHCHISDSGSEKTDGSEWREGSVCQPIFRTNILLASNSNSLLLETFMFPEIWSTQERRE